MMENFFHGLNSLGISYILISGQATVLYGAATFSEDIDLWVEPNVSNWNKFLGFITDTGARIYKLTPPISMEHIKEGHGFHFQLPVKNEKFPFWFLDVMGVVPRVRSFEQSFKNVVYHRTDWGRLPVLGIRELVEIKKTRRLGDYSVISNLVKIEYERLRHTKINSIDWKWILMNSFEVEDILYYLGNNSLARRIGGTLSRPSISSCINSLTNQKNRERYIESASKDIMLEIEDLRRQDRIYWEPIIDQLKDMKRKGQLLKPGTRPPDIVKA